MPITEAMSMGKPVLVTNWSGVTAFVDESVGYPISYTLADVGDTDTFWFRNSRWAYPNVAHVRERMREVVANPEAAAAKGKRGRERMIAQYSPDVVTRLLLDEFDRISDIIR